MEIKAKNLVIRALTTAELSSYINEPEALGKKMGLKIKEIQDDHLEQAHREMLELCLEHPKEYIWYTDWLIILEEEQRVVGSIGFKGRSSDNYKVEVGYGIEEEYQKKGYCTEALKAIVSWAFDEGKVYCVQAQTEEDNIPSQRLLKKCGFKHIGMGEEGLLWEKVNR